MFDDDLLDAMDHEQPSQEESRGSPNAPADTEVQESLLACACRRRDLFQVQALLRDKSDPNERNKAGETPLLEAAAGGDLNVVALLLGHTADPAKRALQGIEEADRELRPPVRMLFEVFRDKNIEPEDRRSLLTSLDPAALAQVRNFLRLGKAGNAKLSQSRRGSAPACLGSKASVRETEATADHRVALHLDDPVRPMLLLSPLERRPTAAVVLLHGLFQSGRMLERMARDLSRILPHARFIAPTAPTQPSLFGLGPAWFGEMSVEAVKESCKACSKEVIQILEQEQKAGISLDRIVLGGFSQGGAVAAVTALQLPKAVAGLVLFGTGGISWSGSHADFSKAGQSGQGIAGLKVLQCHGDRDMMAKPEEARRDAEILQGLGCDVRFSPYSGVGHTISAAMVADVRQWLSERLPETSLSARAAPAANHDAVKFDITEPIASDTQVIADKNIGVTESTGENENVIVDTDALAQLLAYELPLEACNTALQKFRNDADAALEFLLDAEDEREAEAELERKQAEEAQLQAELEEKRKADEQVAKEEEEAARVQAELKLEREARLRAEWQAKQKADDEEKKALQLQAQRESQKLLDEENRQRAELEQIRKDEEKAQAQLAELEAKRKTEEEEEARLQFELERRYREESEDSPASIETPKYTPQPTPSESSSAGRQNLKQGEQYLEEPARPLKSSNLQMLKQEVLAQLLAHDLPLKACEAALPRFGYDADMALDFLMDTDEGWQLVESAMNEDANSSCETEQKHSNTATPPYVQEFKIGTPSDVGEMEVEENDLEWRTLEQSFDCHVDVELESGLNNVESQEPTSAEDISASASVHEAEIGIEEPGQSRRCETDVTKAEVAEAALSAAAAFEVEAAVPSGTAAESDTAAASSIAGTARKQGPAAGNDAGDLDHMNAAFGTASTSGRNSTCDAAGTAGTTNTAGAPGDRDELASNLVAGTADQGQQQQQANSRTGTASVDRAPERESETQVLEQSSSDEPLAVAAKLGNFKQVKQLLKKGADPNMPDARGEIPLFAAARRGDIMMVAIFLLAKADPNWRSASSASALELAMHSETRALLELASGIKVGVREQLAVFDALECVTPFLIQLLLEDRGIQPAVTNVASQSGDLVCIEKGRQVCAPVAVAA